MGSENVTVPMVGVLWREVDEAEKEFDFFNHQHPGSIDGGYIRLHQRQQGLCIGALPPIIKLIFKFELYYNKTRILKTLNWSIKISVAKNYI